jgi:hypothetical protein
MELERAILDLRAETPCQECSYCPLAALVKLNPRTLEQHKMVEIYRYKLGQKGEPNLPWDVVYQRWVDLGLASKFGKVYSEDKSFRQMKREIFGND